jgi:glycosyltransferase EpsE
MIITEITILVPVFRSSKEEIKNFFKQLVATNFKPNLYFVYEENSCEFDFTNLIDKYSNEYQFISEIKILSGRKGIGYALCAGVESIKTPYIMRHDIGDDILDIRFKEFFRVLKSNPNVDIFYSQALLNNGISEKVSNYPTTLKKLSFRLILRNPICHPTVIFRRSAIIKVGNYNSQLRFCEDFDLWLRAVHNNLNFYCIDIATIRYFAPYHIRPLDHWKTNLHVRIKNLGSPNLLFSLFGITFMAMFIVTPSFIKNLIYKNI